MSCITPITRFINAGASSHFSLFHTWPLNESLVVSVILWPLVGEREPKSCFRNVWVFFVCFFPPFLLLSHEAHSTAQAFVCEHLKMALFTVAGLLSL